MRDKHAASTIVCIHGALGGGWEWAIRARLLRVCGFFVLAPDLMPAVTGSAARVADGLQTRTWRGLTAL
jgi:hypothetical protein